MSNSASSNDLASLYRFDLLLSFDLELIGAFNVVHDSLFQELNGHVRTSMIDATASLTLIIAYVFYSHADTV